MWSQRTEGWFRRHELTYPFAPCYLTPSCVLHRPNRLYLHVGHKKPIELGPPRQARIDQRLCKLRLTNDDSLHRSTTLSVGIPLRIVPLHALEHDSPHVFHLILRKGDVV